MGVARLDLAIGAALLVAGCAAASQTGSAPGPEKLILTEYTAAGLKEYQQGIGATGHGYFVVSADGADYSYWYCAATSCIEARSSYKTRALDDCRAKSGGLDCVVLVQDQTAVRQYETYPIPLPPPSAEVAAIEAAAKPTDPTTWPPAPPAAQMAKKGHPGWAVDQLHGCWVWNRDPKDGDSVTWTGACDSEGKATGGKGVLEWKAKERYVGDMKAGNRDGQGRTVNAWGETYEGGFRNGEHDGQGTYVWSDGARYEGSYKNGYANGFGTYTERSEVYRGEWKNGCFDDGKKKYSIASLDIPGC